MPYLCMNKEDQDKVGGPSNSERAQIGKCSNCDQPVYYDDASMRLAILLGDPRLVCNRCSR